MKRHILAAAWLGAVLTGCAGTPPIRHHTLDAGAPASAPRGTAPSIAITQISLPELIDRPQLVLRAGPGELRVLEQQRWAEPPRREIPRVIAAELGRVLDSTRVVALPVDAQRMDPDFRLVLDVQRLEAVEGQGADADVLWRLEPRQGSPLTGRSSLREVRPFTDVAELVEAQRRALLRVADDIAGTLRAAQVPSGGTEGRRP